MADAIMPNDPSAKKKNLKRIFFGFVLIFFSVFSAGVALYWPQLQKQFFPEMATGAPTPKKAAPVPAPAADAPQVNVAAGEKKTTPREGLMWVDPTTSLHIVTLGKTHGVADGKKLKIYDGTDLVGQVVVDRALETVSYVIPEKSADISKDAYYRVVAE